jgi:hypothetical protein
LPPSFGQIVIVSLTSGSFNPKGGRVTPLIIVQLLCMFLFGTGFVVLGWAMGHFGWISLAFYSGGGLIGLLLASPVMSLLHLRLAAGDEQAAEDISDATSPSGDSPGTGTLPRRKTRERNG